MNEFSSPRECRLRLNQMEAWFRDNQNCYSPTEQVVFRSLFEIAVTPHDVAEMGKALHDRMKSQRQDRPPAAQPSRAPEHSPASITVNQAR